MSHLARKHRSSYFYFVDEAVPPRLALQLSDAIAGRRLPYRWFGEARFERAFDELHVKRLGEGGCRMLIFGLESSVQRVLDLMKKGITPERAAAILTHCAAAGI